MFILIENGDLYTPEHLGKAAILLHGRTIVRIAKPGEIDINNIKGLGLELEVIDASGCVVTPGFIDPHEHLLGGSGERGFATQTPEIMMRELVHAGITTVVGCLGVDSRMKTMAGLLAKVKAFNEEGITAYLYSGGYNVPPTTIMQSLRDDLLFIAEVIGAGELAISDERCMQAQPIELARLVKDTHIGGMLSQKSGVTHFHVGEGKNGMKPIREMLEDFEVEPEWLYPTHIERTPKLMREAIALTRKGVIVDMDVSEEDLAKQLKRFLKLGGSLENLTISTDASIKAPDTLLSQLQDALKNGFALEDLLPLVTTNTAKVLHLKNKGRIDPSCEADILVLDKKSFELRELIAKGKRLIRGGKLAFQEKFLEQSNRRIQLRGKAIPGKKKAA